MVACGQQAEDALKFGLVGDALLQQEPRGFLQRALRRNRLQLVGADLRAQGVVDLQPFDQRDAALIAGLQAGGAAVSLTLAAKPAHETLV